jgi:hypothetical protein
MTKRKTITLPKSQVHFVNEKDLKVTKIAREALNECLAGQRKNIPTHGTRNRDGEKHRTTVSLEPRHTDFIDENDVNLSRLIREEIAARVNKKRVLQQAENEPGEILDEAEQALITITLKSSQSPKNDTIDKEWIQWYKTGKLPPWE